MAYKLNKGERPELNTTIKNNSVNQEKNSTQTSNLPRKKWTYYTTVWNIVWRDH
jgi:hypothetical protein